MIFFFLFLVLKAFFSDSAFLVFFWLSFFLVFAFFFWPLSLQSRFGTLLSFKQLASMTVGQVTQRLGADWPVCAWVQIGLCALGCRLACVRAFSCVLNSMMFLHCLVNVLAVGVAMWQAAQSRHSTTAIPRLGEDCPAVHNEGQSAQSQRSTHLTLRSERLNKLLSL